jgi:hypothetical protein
VGGRFCLSLVLNRHPVSEGGLEEGDYKVQALSVCSASVLS